MIRHIDNLFTKIPMGVWHTDVKLAFYNPIRNVHIMYLEIRKFFFEHNK